MKTAPGGGAEPDKVPQHRFVDAIKGSSQRPCAVWMHEHARQEETALETASQNATKVAVHGSRGTGVLVEHNAQDLPDSARPATRKTWSSDLLRLTHVELHRTGKIPEFVKHLKASKSDPRVVVPNPARARLRLRYSPVKDFPDTLTDALASAIAIH